MQADILAEVKRIMDEMAVIYGQDFADNWFNAFNQRMNGFDFEIPDLEDKTFEELNPEGAAQKAIDDAAFYEAMGFSPPTTGSLDPLETATGMPIISGLDPSTNMPFITPAEMAALNAFSTGSGPISAEQKQGPGARGKSPIIGDPRSAAFQTASLAGAAHTVNVTINAPAVTTAEVNAAIANGFKNDAMLLEQLYFI